VSIFTGARPRLSDLVGGRFFERVEVLAPLIQAAESWLSGLEESFETDDLRLPVFWLDGRAQAQPPCVRHRTRHP
jgi:hypothetical protein